LPSIDAASMIDGTTFLVRYLMHPQVRVGADLPVPS
jgi:hypothetical protein